MLRYLEKGAPKVHRQALKKQRSNHVVSEKPFETGIVTDLFGQNTEVKLGAADVITGVAALYKAACNRKPIMALL